MTQTFKKILYFISQTLFYFTLFSFIASLVSWNSTWFANEHISSFIFHDDGHMNSEAFLKTYLFLKGGMT